MRHRAKSDHGNGQCFLSFSVTILESNLHFTHMIALLIQMFAHLKKVLYTHTLYFTQFYVFHLIK